MAPVEAEANWAVGGDGPAAGSGGKEIGNVPDVPPAPATSMGRSPKRGYGFQRLEGNMALRPHIRHPRKVGTGNVPESPTPGIALKIESRLEAAG